LLNFFIDLKNKIINYKVINVEAKEVYLIDHVRTPFSNSSSNNPSSDVFSKSWGIELAAKTLKELFEKRLPNKGSTLKKENVDEILSGCSVPLHENSTFGGRYPLFMAKFPVKVPAIMLDRHWGSGMTALHVGFTNIAMGYANVVVALGFDHMTRVPMYSPNSKVKVYGDPPNKLIFDPKSKWYNDDIYDWKTSWSMIQTAQKLSEKEVDYFSKEDMDKLGTLSHNLAEKALESGFFKEEIIPILGHKRGEVDSEMIIDSDNSIQNEVTLEKTKNQPPLSIPGWSGGYTNPLLSKEDYIAKFGTDQGVITFGNSAPLNDGASTCLIMSKEAMEKYNLKPMARMVSIGYASVDPTIIGQSAVLATRMALKHSRLNIDEIDYWEIDEVFCIESLYVADQLRVDWDNKINIHGGSTAIGNPPAATGPRITANLARILKEKNAKYGIATMSCGGGQGTAIVLENINT